MGYSLVVCLCVPQIFSFSTEKHIRTDDYKTVCVWVFFADTVAFSLSVSVTVRSSFIVFVLYTLTCTEMGSLKQVWMHSAPIVPLAALQGALLIGWKSCGLFHEFVIAVLDKQYTDMTKFKAHLCISNRIVVQKL